MSQRPRDDPGLGWNGGWFGLQLGGTLWLLIMAGMLLGRNPGTAACVFGCFLVPNLAGAWMWSRRARLSIRRADLIFLPILGVASIVAVLVTDRAGRWTTMTIGGPDNISAESMVLVIALLVVGLMIFLPLQHRRRANGSRSGAGQDTAPRADEPRR